MKTPDQIAKLRAVLLYVLQSFPQGLDAFKLYEIMFVAQSEHLVKYGKEIFADNFIALAKAPVPSFVYQAITKANRDESFDLNDGCVVDDSYEPYDGFKLDVSSKLDEGNELVVNGYHLSEPFRALLSGIEVRDNCLTSSILPDLDYLSGVNKKELDLAVAKVGSMVGDCFCSLSRGAAWQEARVRSYDDPQKNVISYLEMAKAGGA